jgi:pectinesterase
MKKQAGRQRFAGTLFLGPAYAGSSLWAGTEKWDEFVDPAKGDNLGTALIRARGPERPYRIRIGRGVLTEKLDLDIPHLVIEGQGPESVVRFDVVSSGLRPDGERWGTAGLGTLTLSAPGITLRNLTIENSYDYLSGKRVGLVGTQAAGL